jgi:sulfur relay (sulfurtransferase) DsrC/TusE family protein
MTGIKTTLDSMGFPQSIVSLILSFHYIASPTNNNEIFKLFDDFINIIRYAKTFCRVYNLKFSKKIMIAVEDTKFGFSEAYARHYVHYIDETHFQQSINTKVFACYPNPTRYDLEIPIETMICASYSMARTIAFSPFQLRIELFCKGCYKDLTIIYPEHTMADKIDAGQIATACIKHR